MITARRRNQWRAARGNSKVRSPAFRRKAAAINSLPPKGGTTNIGHESARIRGLCCLREKIMRNNKLVKIVVWVLVILVTVGLVLPIFLSMLGIL